MHGMFFFHVMLVITLTCVATIEECELGIYWVSYKGWKTNMFTIMCLGQTKKIEIKLTQNNAL
jgi:hypothetical protein